MRGFILLVVGLGLFLAVLRFGYDAAQRGVPPFDLAKSPFELRIEPSEVQLVHLAEIGFVRSVH
jgi:hypothetical protein